MCRGPLNLKVLSQAEEVQEGVFCCVKRGRIYPLINGIPRLLPDALVHLIPVYHREFFRRNRTTMASFLARCVEREGQWWVAEGRTFREL